MLFKCIEPHPKARGYRYHVPYLSERPKLTQQRQAIAQFSAVLENYFTQIRDCFTAVQLHFHSIQARPQSANDLVRVKVY